MEITVLCYHGVSETWPAETTVTPGALERQIAWYADRGYRPATLTGALTDPPGERTLVVTFDDAHLSVLEEAAPILAERGVVATVYAPTGYVDSGDLMAWDGYNIWLGTPHEQELRPMSWQQLGGLMERGWEVGSHTVSHPKLTEVDDDERLAEELDASRLRCVDELGVVDPTLAYPYGYHDARVRTAAGEAGYRVAVSMPQRPSPFLPMAWPRVGVYRHDSPRRLALRAWRYSQLGESGAISRAIEWALSLRR
ncbi:MAG TPA: polysaccharide deacetylase family protein [Solirubrobacterales bacterium]